MAKNSKGQVIFLLGGNNADKINPLGLIKRYKAVCVNEHKTLSKIWRDTKNEATKDAIDCINKGHKIDYDTEIGFPS